MENKVELRPNGIYAEDSDDESPVKQVDDEVILPSKAKYDKFVEEAKQREILHRPKHLNIEVDRQCEIEDVHVYEDYSVTLI